MCFAGGTGHLWCYVCPDLLQDVDHFLTCHNNMTSKTSIFIMWHLLVFILSRVGRACILEIKHSCILLHDLSHHYLSFFLVLDMSSVKLSRTRRLATLLSCLLWDFRMIEVLLVIFMSPYLVHLPPLFMGALRNVSGNLCVTFLQVCLFLNEWQTSWCLEQLRQSSLKPEGRNQGCTQA